MASKINKPKLMHNGKRLDGRMPDELRKIRIEAGVLKNANGSAYLEWGKNRIIAAIYGPRDVVPKHFADPNAAIIKCRYSMAPFSSLEEHGRAGQNRRAIEISKVIKEVFENAVILEEFPNSEIDIFLEVLQSDGSTRAACINAAAVALASAGIPMKDMVYGVSVGKVDGEICVDVDMIEDNYSEADMPMAISHRDNRILLLQMDGEMDSSEIRKGFDMAVAAGEKIKSLQREALLQMYKGV